MKTERTQKIKRLKVRPYLSAMVILISTSVIAQMQSPPDPPEVVCHKEFKTSNNCYRLFKPTGLARALVVLLPKGGGGGDANAFSAFQIPKLLAQKDILSMSVSQAGYVSDDDLTTLLSLIREVAAAHRIPSGKVVVAGISSGGTGALRYTEYCESHECGTIKPCAVVSVDAPLDFEHWWNSQVINIRRGDPGSNLEESRAILDSLNQAMGGSPTEARAAYRAKSPFLAMEKDGGNARLIKIPTRLYTEPDINWLLDNWKRDYYTSNAVDQAALVLQLRAQDNRKVELVTTSGKGHNLDGTRNPHSWSIVDEDELVNWITTRLRE
jgi:poly(3-hydroxybutyrate) depolymerase